MLKGRYTFSKKPDVKKTINQNAKKCFALQNDIWKTKQNENKNKKQDQ